MIDPKLLPNTALVDSGVLIRALGDRPNDVRSPDCVAFWDGMQNAGRMIQVAAPSVAELLRGSTGRDVPHSPHVTVVPFDRSAAVLLGKRFPHETLKEFAPKKGDLREYYLYDALIVACAVRWKADCIVAFDRQELTQMATAMKMPVKNPMAFRAPQGVLPFPCSPSSAKPGPTG